MDNQHEWKLGYTDSGDNSGKHGPLWEESDKGWLKAGSLVLDASVAIVLDERFINRIPYYLNSGILFLRFKMQDNYVMS